MPRPARAAAPIRFHTTKYGPELLVDIAFVHEMPAFIVDRPHALAFYDIILVTAGRGHFILDGTRHRVKPGTVFFTAPGQLRIWDVTGLDGVCLFFPALFLEEFFNDPHFLQRLPYFHGAARGTVDLAARRANPLRRRLLAMQRELHRLRADSVHLLRAQVYEVLVTLARAYTAAHREAESSSPNRVTLRYLELIDRDLSEHRLVAEYARDLAVSPGYLNTLCKRHLGKHAKELIADRLVLEARRLLLYSDQSAAQLAERLGFDDPSYFSRFFRARTGESPREFRAQHL